MASTARFVSRRRILTLAPSLLRPPARCFTTTPSSQSSASSSTSSTPSTSGSYLRTGVYATILAVSTGLFTVYYLDSRSALHRYFLTPVLRYTLDAETGHKFALKVLGSGFAPRDALGDEEILECKVWGKSISNPIGLAAGFDKDGEAIDGIFNLGFSWVEIGSVTPRPQPGNPRPRVFHLIEDSALINRYGFPSQGHTAVLSRLRARVPRFLQWADADEAEGVNRSFKDGRLLAVNLGKNKDSPQEDVDDFVKGVKIFGPHADVLVVNVSSPNTPGLRGLQNRESLEKLLTSVTNARDTLATSTTNTSTTKNKPKIVLKIAPDLDEPQLIDIAHVILSSGIDGVIVSNTTTQRPATLSSPNKSSPGGLSGAPLKPLSLQTLRTLRTHLPPSIPLIGCGGIQSGKDALEYAKAGASMVQIYTSFGYDGVGACRRIKDELQTELRREGKSWGDVVSEGVRALSLKEETKEKGQDPTVKQLIEEAEELKRMIERLSLSEEFSNTPERPGVDMEKVGATSAVAVAGTPGL